MKNVIAFIIAFSPVLAFADVKSEVAAVEAATDKCLDNPDNHSTYGMNMCLGEGNDGMNKILNKVYRSIVTDLKKKTGDVDSDKSNAEILSRLVKAQRAWVTYRDAQSELNGIEMLGGTGESQIVLGTLYRMTKERVLELHELLGGTN